MIAQTVIKRIQNLPSEERRKVLRFVLADRVDAADAGGQPAVTSRRPNLHPGSMEMAPDFDAPLSDDFRPEQESRLTGASRKIGPQTLVFKSVPLF